MTEETKYLCPVCFCVATQSEMGADYRYYGEFDEYEEWSNWICPSCGRWYGELEDWVELEQNK